MNLRNKRNHMVDFLFPLALLFVFALSALVVTVFATSVYENTVTDSNRNDASRTALSYVTEKVHQSDSGGDVRIGSYCGYEALIIDTVIEDKEYSTYIYSNGEQLVEALLSSNYEGDTASGTPIMDIDNFDISQINDKLIKLSCIDDDGDQASTVIAIRSGNK